MEQKIQCYKAYTFPYLSMRMPFKVTSREAPISANIAIQSVAYPNSVRTKNTALISKLKKRLKRLEDFRERQVMETVTGNRLFNQKLDQQIDLFKTLVAEHQLTQLP